MNAAFVVADAVAEALASGAPVVALESTLIAHGLPYPSNLEVAHELEAEVRAGGAVPATIAVVGGRVRVGLDAETLHAVARGGREFAKAGATDLPVHMARGTNAATTVAATAAVAVQAGIRVFATGGIGGVHRGDAGDISHDLTALARTPLAVVSAGAKAILDLPRTVEALETLGVLVVGYRCDEFPAFYGPRSGLPLEHRIDELDELARVCRVRWDDLGQGGVLVCNPIPAEHALPDEELQAAIASALREADAGGITGKRLTPFLLAELARTTRGRAVEANRALARHNATVAAGLAVALARR
ncbi:MAG TPA: pseudouridine-5'-phosphate glycosidase [Kofleriaceae bacterium]|nr:pseudouridine-5'-phosphate glycosidase [Kofleriaceae bacterium]